MIFALQQTEVYERLNHSDNPASRYVNDERLKWDVWDIRRDLPPLAEQAHIYGRKTINFGFISLAWLKDLTKLAVIIAVSKRQWSLGLVNQVIRASKNFSAWLIEQGYVTLSALTAQVVQRWMQDRNATNQLSGLLALLRILRQLNCIQFQVTFKQPRSWDSPQIIPEDVKYKLDLALEELEQPIYLIFKLLAALGTRSLEIPKIPLDCLRRRAGVARIRLCTGKQNDSKQEQDLPEELVTLVEQQQAFVRQRFGEDFPWLFAQWKARRGFQNKDWPPTFRYYRQQIGDLNAKLNRLLKRLIEEKDIHTGDGKLANVTLHMYRRTYATVAARMGKRPDQIQHGLRHLNLDMQDSYVHVTPQEQERRTERVLVDKKGHCTVYRTDQDSKFLRQEWKARQVELGICTRPSIQEECQFEYVCLGCEHVRFAEEHLTQLLNLLKMHQLLLERCEKEGKSDSRRANSARQLLSLLEPIIAKLQQSRREPTG